MRRIKKFLKDRRGVAIEFAVGVMFLTVAVSTILLTTALRINSHRQRDLEELEQKIAAGNMLAEEAREKARENQPLPGMEEAAPDITFELLPTGEVVTISYSDGAWTVISIEPKQ